MMKLDIKKTGLIIVASSAFMVANAQAAEDGFSVYGNVGIELHQISSKAKKDAKSVGGLTTVDGGNRFGFKGSRSYDGGAVASVSGNLEVGVALNGNDVGTDEGKSTSFVGRQANVQVALRNGGTLGLGQQNNLRVGSGWMANSWWDYAAALPRAVNTARYTGIKYVHGFGIGSVGIMLGMDGIDNGADETLPKVTTSETSFQDEAATSTPTYDKKAGVPAKANNAIDKLTVLLSLNPTKALGIQVGYDSAKGDNTEDPMEETDTALAVSYGAGPVKAHLGYAMYSKSQGKLAEDKTSISLNATFNAGSVSPFVGYRQSEHSNKDAKGEKEDDLKVETGISVGVNLSKILGGSGFVGYDAWANKGGTEGNDETAIKFGLFYTFATANIGMRN
jgi:hypothetical protein